MAGRIKSSDVEEVKQRTNIADLVGDYVSLKNAGADSMKGLCPFHDERSPSFHVRPGLGYFHCFGCGESGDAISFLQRMDHLTFTEAVERMAARTNYVLTYEEGGGQREEGPPRARLLTANKAAEKFFIEQLASAEAESARTFLGARGFDAAACERFGVGYAPRGWEWMTKRLTADGFNRQELLLAGLVSEGQRGVYDRFRGRIIWPIRDTSGQTIGFGARKLYEDDSGPKYLNTPETPVYRKSQVLYGLDVSKKAISRGHRAVVVEGYTDVMACHLAGEEAAVATCGTAFGQDHIAVLRRIMGDDSAAEVIFTFDPDEAGQKAALRAFSEEKRFTAQTYVAVAPDGLDPADLRLRHGDEAIRDLFSRKVPLFEFALREAVKRFDLNSVEGRLNALRSAAPIVAEIKDPSLRPGYARELARMLGVDLAEMQRAMRSLASQGAPGHPPRMPPEIRSTTNEVGLGSLPSTPSVRLERDALMAMLQQGPAIGQELINQAATAEVSDPSLRVVRNAIAATIGALTQPGWFEAVLAETPESHQPLVRALAFAPLPVPTQLSAEPVDYARQVISSLLDRDLLALKAELVSRMQRVGDPSSPESRRIQEQLSSLETARRALRTD